MQLGYDIYGEINECCYDTINTLKASTLGCNTFCECGTSFKSVTLDSLYIEVFGEELAKKAKKDPTTIQTIIFNKDKFDRKSAIKWAKDHKYKVSKIYETENSYRIRQKDSNQFQEGTLRTITLVSGVKAVIGRLKKENKPVNLVEKPRGSGQGQGGPKQGDGGTAICKCPNCGYETTHDKGIPCSDIECPECKVAMVGKSIRQAVLKETSIHHEGVTEETLEHVHPFVFSGLFGPNGKMIDDYGFTTATSKGPAHSHNIKHLHVTEPADDGHTHVLLMPSVVPYDSDSKPLAEDAITALDQRDSFTER